MHAQPRGAAPPSPTVSIRHDGATIEAIAGETIAAALHAAGRRRMRFDRAGAQRGIYCGMGVCQECLVVVDGVAGLRACMTSVRAGMVIESQRYAPAMAARDVPAEDAPQPAIAPDMLVIGAGAAGLAAARAAASAGASVVLIDERPEPGGQFFKQLAMAHAAGVAGADRQMRAGAALIAAAREAGVALVGGATAWGAFSPREIAVEVAGATHLYAPSQLVVATGAHERGWAVPGWTLPGAMTTGAAQTLLRAYRVLAGRRILVAGNGPLNLQVAAELRRHGATIVAVAESAAAPGPRHWRSLVKMARAAPDLLRDGLAYRLALARRGVPVLHRHVVARIEGDEEVAAVHLQALDRAGAPIAGRVRRFEVDTVCLGYGFLPQNELARALGCRHEWDRRRGHLVALRDADMRSTVPGVYLAGDGAGLNGARAAVAEGTIAGIAAARALGKPIPPSLEAALRRARADRARALAFQEALWALYRAPAAIAALEQPDDMVCRCEEVRRREIAAALVAGADIGAVKRATRAGMGRCQGRYCGPAIAGAIAAASGTEPHERDFFAPRAPARPVPLSAIARREHQ
jgi:thioredoxin reductase